MREADLPEVAAQVILAYDTQCASGITTHRVSDLFCSKDGNLRADLVDFASSGRMSENLRTEITAYQLAPLDDSASEGPHAHVSRTVRTKPAARPATWSYELRLKQSISLMKSLDSEQPGLFAKLFDHWKVIYQWDPAKVARSVRAKQRPTEVRDFVYRLGNHALRDYSSMRSLVHHKGNVKTSVSDIVALKVDFLQAVLIVGAVYSFPGNSGFNKLECLGKAVSAPEGSSAGSAPPTVFKVIDFGAFGMRFVDTQGMQCMRQWKTGNNTVSRGQCARPWDNCGLPSVAPEAG